MTAAQLKAEAHLEAVNDEAFRQTYAKEMENRLLSISYNVDVNAVGPHHTTLRLKWIFVSKVTAYQFTQDGADMFRTMREAGFTKFTITDGYDESWTWDLKPQK